MGQVLTLTFLSLQFLQPFDGLPTFGIIEKRLVRVDERVWGFSKAVGLRKESRRSQRKGRLDSNTFAARQGVYLRLKLTLHQTVHCKYSRRCIDLELRCCYKIECDSGLGPEVVTGQEVPHSSKPSYR